MKKMGYKNGILTD